MKKHILAIILCVLCASLVFVLASCGDTNTNTNTDSGECTEHSFGDWTTETYASCTSAGLKVRVCTKCSFEEEEEIPAGHKFGDWETVKEVSCEVDGLEERICSACDFVEPKEIKAEGHDWGDWEVSVPGDCTTKGEEKKVCGNCGADETREIAANGHNWTDWGIGWDNEEYAEDPTCTEEGYLGRVCLECGDEERDPIPVKGHEWGDWNVVGSCADGATKTRECTACGEDETETTQPGEHANIVFEGAKAPTLEEDGSTGTKKCLACGEILAPEMVLRYSNIANQAVVTTNVEHWIPTTGLPWLVDGNRETGARTSYNHATVRFVLEFNENKNIDKIVIVVNGKGSTSDYKSVEEVTNLDFPVSVTLYNKDGDIVDQQSYKTKDTIELILKPTEEISKIAINVQCDYDHTRAIWEVETFATSVLSACDIAGSHTWGDWVNVSQPVCNQDGSLTNGLETRECSACGQVEENVLTASHSFGEWDESNVACITGGTKTRECSKCEYVESQTVEAGGHIETELQGAKEPTLESDGSTGTLVCKKCGAIIEEAVVIPKLVNVAIGGTISTTDDFWAYESKYLVQLNDGNKNTGVGSSTKITTHKLRIDFAESSDLIKLVFVVNSTGSSTGLGTFETLTNNSYELYFKLFDAEGNEVYSSSKYQTADQTEIIVELENSINAKYIEIYRYKQEYGSAVNAILWEVEAIAKGKVAE